MKVYFVRHGESEDNLLKQISRPTSKLSKLGAKQAKFVSKRFKNIPIDLVISSNYMRAIQTAEIINKVLKKEIVISELAKEVKRPSVVEGKSYKDPEILEIRKFFIENFGNDGVKHSDEENFNDLKRRAEEFIKFLENQKAENILVVSHGLFITIIIYTLCLKDKFTAKLFEDLDHFFAIKNTAITILERSAAKSWKYHQNEELVWSAITWNDFAHLGEVEE